MMTLYHGSSVSVPEPLTGVGRRELDFGPGFYLTNLREQAERWARRVCIVRAADTPLLSIYEFDESLLPADVRRLRLEHYDQQWLDFIAHLLQHGLADLALQLRRIEKEDAACLRYPRFKASDDASAIWLRVS